MNRAANYPMQTPTDGSCVVVLAGACTQSEAFGPPQDRTDEVTRSFTPGTFLFFLVVITALKCAADPGIFAASLRGRVTAAAHGEARAGASFVMGAVTGASPLAEQSIRTSIDAKLRARGLVPAADGSKPTYEVRCTIHLGNPKVVSSPDFVVGGHSVSTVFPRFFEIIVLDVSAGAETGQPIPVWQAELFSEGGGTDLGYLAPYFIEEAFQQWGKTASNVKFKVKVRR